VESPLLKVAIEQWKFRALDALEARLEEQRYFAVYFHDYKYLQHLQKISLKAIMM